MELLSLDPLWLLLLIAVLALGLRMSLVDMPFWRQALALLFRTLAIIALIVGLCRPYWLKPSDDLHVVFIVDVSDSVDLDAIEVAADEVKASIDQLAAADSWSLFAAAKEVRPFDSPEKLQTLVSSWREGIQDNQLRGESRIAEAMLETRLAFPAGKSRRIILFSDGRETNTDLQSAISQLATEGINLQFSELSTITDPEVGIASLEPTTSSAFQNEVVRFRAQVHSNRQTNAKVRITHNGVEESSQTVRLKPDEPNLIEFDVEVRSAGAARYLAEVIVDEDYFPLNNQAGCTLNVSGEPRVLVLHQKPQEMRPLARALEEQGIELDVRGRFGLPESLEEVLAFDAVIIADLPATDLSYRQMEILKRYVVDYGGGLIMLGSDNSFGLGGYFKTPVEEVLPLVSRFEKEKEKPSLAMVLVIDKSGSMQGTPIALARQAAKAAAELLSMRDMIGVVGFDGDARIISEMRSAGDIDAIHAAVDSLQAGGGTYMYPGMVQARDMLLTASAKVRHMIILSDGHTQPADHHSLTQEATDDGITVSTVALGGADKQLLSSIAEIGQGRYYETDDPSNVPQIFTKETMQASKSAIKEDLFSGIQTSDHPMLSGFSDSELPFSLGYVMTESKPTAQLLLVTESGDPLLAFGRYGLGSGLAFTSDLTEKWGGEWLAWESFGKFWSQVIRSVLRKSDVAGLLVTSEVKNNRWDIKLKRQDDLGAPVSKINYQATATNEYGKQVPISIRETGLGRYETTVPLAEAANVNLRLYDSDYDKLKVMHWQRPYPAEYSLANQTNNALAKVSAYAPGSIRDDLVQEDSRKSVAHYSYFTALALLIVGLILRRV